MARQVSEQACAAFRNAYKLTVGNTSVTVSQEQDKEVVRLTLHGNLIAERVGGQTSITNCGYFTAVTKERLNCLPGVDLYQKGGRWFLNGKEWDGEWITL
jgi:hypothetical protein